MIDRHPTLLAATILLAGFALLATLVQVTAIPGADTVSAPATVQANFSAIEIATAANAETSSQCTSEEMGHSPDCHSGIVAALDAEPAGVPPRFQAAAIGKLSDAPGFREPDPPKRFS